MGLWVWSSLLATCPRFSRFAALTVRHSLYNTSRIEELQNQGAS